MDKKEWDKIRAKGRKAWHDGYGELDNPYLPVTQLEQNQAWFDGWWDAKHLGMNEFGCGERWEGADTKRLDTPALTDHSASDENGRNGAHDGWVACRKEWGNDWWKKPETYSWKGD